MSPVDDIDGEDAAIAEAMAVEAPEGGAPSRRLFGGRRRPRLAGGRPHLVGVRFTDEVVDNLPTTSVGKIDKKALRAAYWDTLGRAIN